jgi:hypothetical protein
MAVCATTAYIVTTGACRTQLFLNCCMDFALAQNRSSLVTGWVFDTPL